MASEGSKMEYNHLGRSGLKVSNICLGAMTFGKDPKSPQVPSQLDEENSFKIMDRFVELGGNFIDTANVYGHGLSEQIVGNWLKTQNRNKVVIATKVRTAMGSGPNDVGLSRRHIVQMCDDSLSRLQTDFIDLYQTHCWDSATPIEETLRTLNDLVRCGKVRYLGVSNVRGWQLQKIVDHIKFMGLSPVVSLQQQYNLVCRHPEHEEFQVCSEEGIGVIPWSPLKGGILTGKYKRESEVSESGTRIDFFTKNKMSMQAAPNWSNFADNDFYWNIIDNLGNIATAHDKTKAQVALRWLLQKSVVSSVIIGATSIQQLENNVGAGSGWSLTTEEMTKLDEASKTDGIYPYEMIDRLNSARINPFMASTKVVNKL